MSNEIKNEFEEQKSSVFSESTKKKSRKKKIAIAGAATGGVSVGVTFSILGVILLALIITLFWVLILKPAVTPDPPKFDVWEGEDTYGNAAHLVYPLVDESTITKMEIYIEGKEHIFLPVWDENLGKYDWRIEGFEKIDLDATTFEMLRMWLCTLTTKDPIRNASEKDLIAYELDKKDHNGFKIYYEENGQEKTHTVRIGKQTNLSTNEYYAYVEGRRHVYKISKDVITYAQYSHLKYLSPIINTFFKSETAALMGIDKFDIYLTDGSNTSLKNVVTVKVDERGETTVSFKAVYGLDEYGRRRTTIANTSYASTVFSTLYTSFSGSEVVAVNPTEDELRAFGLDSATEKYYVNVEFADIAEFASSSYKDNEPSLYISTERDGCHYVLSKYYGQTLVVKVLKESLSFLGSDSFSLLKWTDVNSITTGFYETLTENDEGGIGLKEIYVTTSNGVSETFLLSYDKENDELTATCKEAGLVFKDDNTKTGFERNLFRNLYVYMLYYPFINSFNQMSDEATMEYIKPENAIYSITAIRNDDTAVRYTYYKISASLAIESVETGKVVGGELSFGEPSYGNICTVEEIRRVTNATEKLLRGETLLPDEDVLA